MVILNRMIGVCCDLVAQQRKDTAEVRESVDAMKEMVKEMQKVMEDERVEV